MVDRKLIYADDFISSLRDDPLINGANFKRVVQHINDAPAVDAEPVKRGRWVARKNCAGSTVFKCSECSREVEVTNDYFGKPSKHTAKHYPYCHCGAKMDGGNEDG